MPFRFENLEIWKQSADVALKLFDVADDLEGRKLYRFAEQLRGSALSTPQRAESEETEEIPELPADANCRFRLLSAYSLRSPLRSPPRQCCRKKNMLSRTRDLTCVPSPAPGSPLLALCSSLPALRSLLSALPSSHVAITSIQGKAVF